MADDNVEDNVVIQESRRVSVTRTVPELHNNRTDMPLAGKMGNTIDVHRLQKNIDNWTIQVRDCDRLFGERETCAASFFSPATGNFFFGFSW